MTKIYFALFALCVSYAGFAQCTPRALPYGETFATNPLQACTPTLGGWSGTSATSGAGWWVPSTNYAGAGVPEMEAYGDQANGGVQETISLTSPPINTSSISSYTLSFKHNIYTTNGGASGSGLITIKVEASNNLTNWTQLHTGSYNATASLNSVLLETRTIPVSAGFTDTTYFRWSVTGVLFKLWGWEIDNVIVQGTTGTTGIQGSNGSDFAVTPNPFSENLKVKVASGGAQISITDVLGKTVFEKHTSETEIDIDTRSLPAGMYTLRTFGSDGAVSHKIIKN